MKPNQQELAAATLSEALAQQFRQQALRDPQAAQQRLRELLGMLEQEPLTVGPESVGSLDSLRSLLQGLHSISLAVGQSPKATQEFLRMSPANQQAAAQEMWQLAPLLTAG